MPLPTDSKQAWPPASVPQLDLAVWSEWYSGKFSPAGNALSTIPLTTNSVTERFTGGFVHRHGNQQLGSATNPRSGSQTVHCPLAADIAQVSSALLFGDMPGVRITDAGAEASQKRLTELIELGSVQNTLLESAEVCAALGGSYLRVTWDKETVDHPFITSVDADRAVPEFRFGHLVAVTFWREVATEGDKVYRHLERHEPGVILHGLYLGTKNELGTSVGLDQSPETTGLKDVVTLPDSLQKSLVAFYVPNMRPNPGNRGSYLGRADIGGAEGLLDALDEDWSGLMRDVRLGQGHIIVPSGTLSPGDPANPRGSGKSLDLDREVFTEIDVPPEGMQPTAIQHDIRVEKYILAITEKVKQIVSNAGYSPQTFGLDISGQSHSGTALRLREEKTYRTLGRKRRYWETALSHAFEALLSVDASEFGSGVAAVAPDIEWPEEAMSLSDIAATVQQLHTAAAASTATLVRLVNPGWDKKQVDDEVALIQAESGTAVPSPMQDGLLA
jgi:A118 family predicted phage portal protein